MIRYFSIAATGLVCALLLLSALPFGGAAAWAIAALEGAALLSLALAILGVPKLGYLRSGALAPMALAGVAILGWLQTLSDAGTASEAAAVSLAPYRTSSSALLWATYAVLGLAAVLLGRSRPSRRAMAASLVVAALFQCSYGARSWMAGSSTIWGREFVDPSGRFRGTFVNPDHYAMFLAVVLGVVFAWGWWAVRRAGRPASLETRLILVAPPVAVWLTLFACLAFSGSRAGLVAAAAAALVQGALAVGSARRRRLALAGLAGTLAVLAALAFFGLRRGFDRLAGTSVADVTFNSRLAVYEACLDLWARAPWVGTGLGTFRDAFPAVQPEGVGGLWLHAHSGPLEILITAGLIGFCLVLFAVAASLVRLLGIQRRGFRSEDRAAALGAVGALVAVLLHEAVDFGLTLPANAAALVVVVGAAQGARFVRRFSPPAGAGSRGAPRRPRG